jgi:lysophospholipase L1-like esterase
VKLTYQQICDITQGAAYISEEDGCAIFHRFTKEQEELYRRTNQGFYQKALAPAGVVLQFRTDSSWITLTGETSAASTRTYYSIDVLEDGVPAGHVDNFSQLTLPEDYTKCAYPLGDFAKTIPLKAGVKSVTICMPWSVQVVLKELSLSDGSTIMSDRPQKKLLAFGDSITQGYDALRPMNRYVFQLARSLNAVEYNKAIGGEVFFPALANTREDWTPNLILVAYGTNDWSKLGRDTFLENARMFLRTLRDQYTGAKLFVMQPIWREDRDSQREYGTFDLMRQDLAQICSELDLQTVDCYSFVPKDASYFADLRLHPNDKGFASYSRQLISAVKALI